MISRDTLIQILIKGRYESYVMKSERYNPYIKSDIYDWKFTYPVAGFIYTDVYRGFNPYSGVEYIYTVGEDLPVWSCDYVGYVLPDTGIPANKVYMFLKEARKAHLTNCKENLFSNYHYRNDGLQYNFSFTGDLDALLQTEEFYFDDMLIARQISAGRLKV